MWAARREELSDARGLRFTVTLDSRPATVAEVIRAWQHEANYRSLFNATLADAPYPSFRWETPAVTANTVGQPFEFVLLNSPGLASRPDPVAFAEHFTDTTHDVVVFSNLG